MNTSPTPVVTSGKTRRDVYGSFFVDGIELVLPVSDIQEVVNYPERMISVPLAPDLLDGIFNLRGMIIPVLSLRKLLNLRPEAPTATSKVAIVHFQGARVGLIFDSTSEVIATAPDQVIPFQKTESDSHGVIRGALRLKDGERIIQILDPSSLIKIKNIPQVLEHLKQNAQLAAKRSSASRKQAISFRAGRTKFAFEIGAINEIIRLPEIKSSCLDAASCIGMFTLRGNVIPVIDFAKFLGIDEANPSHQQNSADDERRILITQAGQHSIGLLITAVDSILSFIKDDVHPIPLFSDQRSQLFSGMLMKENCDDVILLNQNGLLTSAEIHELTKGHSQLYSSAHATQTAATKKNSRERNVYLNFRLDHSFSVSIKSINEIITYPTNVMTPPGLPAHVRGVANLRQSVVTIVDLRILFDLKPAPRSKDETNAEATKEEKILVIRRGTSHIGFVVDAVEDIASINEAQQTNLSTSLIAASASNAHKFVREIVTSKELSGQSRQFMIVDIDEILQRLDAAA